MAVASGGVVDRVNTTSGFASSVVAFGTVAGAGVVDLESGVIPAGTFIITQSGNFITTEAGDFLVTN